MGIARVFLTPLDFPIGLMCAKHTKHPAVQKVHCASNVLIFGTPLSSPDAT